MKTKKSTELNDKIAQIIEASGMTSSIFADYIGLPRPIMSHIVAKRNKATLEIVQKILLKFPELGMGWTFDGTPLNPEMLNKLAIHDSSEQRIGFFDKLIDANAIESGQHKNVLKLIELNEDCTFTNYNPSSNSTNLTSSILDAGISKISVFFDDDSFLTFQPA